MSDYQLLLFVVNVKVLSILVDIICFKFFSVYNLVLLVRRKSVVVSHSNSSSKYLFAIS